MTIFFTADTHFRHDEIVDACQRPFNSVEEHDQVLVENWNALVRPEDEIYILGDFIIAENRDQVESLTRLLNGKKYLVLGDHDNPDLCEGCFEWVKDYHVLNTHEKAWILFHYPIWIWHRHHRDSIHLYGHVHHKPIHPGSPLDLALKDRTNCINVGVDVQGYAPVSAEALLQQIHDQVSH